MKNIDIFCKVIDNYGDAGYTLRCIYSLRKFYNIFLYTDYPELFMKLKPSDDYSLNIFNWNDVKKYAPSEFVIGMFQHIPSENFINEINLKSLYYIMIDYFTPEKWAEESNNTAGYSGKIKIPVKFFVPGIYSKTAGINSYVHEKNTDEKVFNNIYLYNPEKIKDYIRKDVKNILWGKECPGITKMPFMSQDYFDAYLKNSEINWIRGEDSFQLALHSGKIFFWQAYEQENNIHMKKVNAFLEFSEKFFDRKELFSVYSDITLYINDRNRKPDGKTEKNINYIQDNHCELSDVFIRLKYYFNNQHSIQITLTDFINNI